MLLGLFDGLGIYIYIYCKQTCVWKNAQVSQNSDISKVTLPLDKLFLLNSLIFSMN